MASDSKYTPKEGKAVLPVENCLRSWERTQFDFQFILSPGMALILSSTIAHLKELKVLKDKALKDKDK